MPSSPDVEVVAGVASADQEKILATIGRYGAAVDTLNSFKYSQKHVSGHASALDEKNSDLINDKNDNLRDAHMNTYNEKKYEAHTRVVTIFIVICICVILVLSIRNMEYIGTNTANIAISGILVVGGIVMVRHVTDIAMRDNMDYDAYSWQYNYKNNEPSVYEHNKRQFDKITGVKLSGSGEQQDTCVGAACCAEGRDFVNGRCEGFTTIQESIGEHIVSTNNHTIDRIQLPLPNTNVTPLSIHTDCGTCTNH